MKTIKLFALVICMVFLISMVSDEVFKFDNSVEYSEDDMEVKISNFFG